MVISINTLLTEYPWKRGKTTGIKKSDWYPYHWLRWNDAIKEAGLAPNQLSTAISKDTAIEKLGSS